MITLQGTGCLAMEFSLTKKKRTLEACARRRRVLYGVTDRPFGGEVIVIREII
jgi:hypothetical protein